MEEPGFPTPAAHFQHGETPRRLPKRTGHPNRSATGLARLLHETECSARPVASLMETWTLGQAKDASDPLRPRGAGEGRRPASRGRSAALMMPQHRLK